MIQRAVTVKKHVTPDIPNSFKKSGIAKDSNLMGQKNNEIIAVPKGMQFETPVVKDYSLTNQIDDSTYGKV